MRILTYEEAKLNNSVVALGKFEGLHLGHMLLINRVVEEAATYGYDATICTIDFPVDKQINVDSERYSILEECGVDVIIKCSFTNEFASLSPDAFFKSVLIDKLSAKCIVVGSDFRFGYKRKGDVDTLRDFGIKYGVEIAVIDKLSIDGNIISTSFIRNIVEAGRVDVARKYLGRAYSISGEVVKGKQLGRTIGFPTVNIVPDSDKLLPMFGVYESRIFVDGVSYRGLTNVGNNPTVQSDNNVTVETYLLDFSGDLYGKFIKVDFIRFIRPEMKFSSIEGLVEQMNIDKYKVINA